MFDFLFRIKKIYAFSIIVLVLAVGTFVNVKFHTFPGGIFIIAVILTSLAMPQKINYIVAAVIYALAIPMFFYNHIPGRILILNQSTFLVAVAFAAYTGNELKKYINQLIERHSQIEEFNKDLILAFINTMEAKDKYLSGHSLNVSHYARTIAEKMGLSVEECKNIYLAGIFHDIGKIGVSESILNKAGKLAGKEWLEIQKHPETGAEIVSKIPALQGAAEIIKYHHLRYDGKGYPKEAKTKEIPLGARIIAVADAFDAMTSNRSYRGALSAEAALRELEKCKGTQFDPKVVDAFRQCQPLAYSRQKKQNGEFLKETFGPCSIV